jgi:putative acetyltransferase
VDDPASAQASQLIEQLDRYLNGLYPPERNHLLPVGSLKRPNVTFITAWVGGEIAGCGAVVDQDGEYAEIKRMFVLPQFRRLRLGRRLLEELERHARTTGLKIARLETGASQPEALILYERAGYVRRGPFGNYPENGVSVFMEKPLR